jgi:hypothetical protein
MVQAVQRLTHFLGVSLGRIAPVSSFGDLSAGREIAGREPSKIPNDPHLLATKTPCHRGILT